MPRQRTSAARKAPANGARSDAPRKLRPVRGADLWVDRRPRGRPQVRNSDLSGRERGVLLEVARGNSTEEVAEVLNVSPHTVRTYVQSAMRKLDARTRAQAVAIAISEGTIEFKR